MSSTTAVRDPLAPVTVNRPDMVSVGTIVWLSSELMFFAGLFAMYFTIRAVVPGVWDEHQLLNVGFSATNTGVLVSSSFTCQMGVFAAERYKVSRSGSIWDGRTWGMREWYVLTFLMGGFFVAGQIYEYANLIRDGLTIATSPYGSVFFLTTGFHGLHVFGGLIAFLLVIGRSFAARHFGHQEATSAVVVSYYWHFVDVVWIGLFAVIYLIH